MMLAAPDEKPSLPPQAPPPPAVPVWGVGALLTVAAAVGGFLWLLREQNRRDRVHLAKMARYARR